MTTTTHPPASRRLTAPHAATDPKAATCPAGCNASTAKRRGTAPSATRKTTGAVARDTSAGRA